MSGFSACAAPPWTGKGRGRVYANVSEAVGNTPCVEISDAICPNGRTIYAKLEYFSPLSSVKDRTACAIIEDAEKRGLLKHGSTVVEATSGNTGIAIAMLCAQRGYRCTIPDRASQAHALPRSQSDHNSKVGRGNWHGSKSHRAFKEARLVLVR